MPSRPLGDKVDELMRLNATLDERLDYVRREVEEVTPLITRVALLEHQFAELKKAHEEWGRRLWMLLAPFVGAVVGSVLTYFLNSQR
jgi:dynactin complex subunit